MLIEENSNRPKRCLEMGYFVWMGREVYTSNVRRYKLFGFYPPNCQLRALKVKRCVARVVRPAEILICTDGRCLCKPPFPTKIRQFLFVWSRITITYFRRTGVVKFPHCTPYAFVHRKFPLCGSPCKNFFKVYIQTQ